MRDIHADTFAAFDESLSVKNDHTVLFSLDTILGLDPQSSLALSVGEETTAIRFVSVLDFVYFLTILNHKHQQ